MNSIETPNYKISVMSQNEISKAISWAKNEGWNPGIHDAVAFYKADATGFLAGKYNDQIIATISAVKYGKDFGFIGLYIVKDEFRGKGFGFRLWEAAISSLSDRNIGLDGVLAQQDNYKKSGFKLAHRNIRFAGKSTKRSLPTRAIASEHIEFNDIANYDSQFFPDERSTFLENWITPENSQTLAIVENSRILGYGSIRACDRGYKIGPLNAETSDIAV
jgi:GNAT superfamily N-acetyltransferase